jgi:spermidine/putrescine-binding protein
MELDEMLSNPQSRRRFLKIAGASMLAAAPFAGSRTALAQMKGPVLWYAWGTLYSKPYLLEPWSEATGIEIKQIPWSGADEMVTKMRAGGSGLFDTAAIPQQFLRLFADEDLIEPIDLANVPNYDRLFPEFKESPYIKFDGNVWGIPWVWGANAMAYNKEDIPSVTSMDALFDKKYEGRISMRDDPEDSLAVGALYLGIKQPFSMDDNQLAEVKKLLLKQRPLIRSYWKGPSDLKILFGNREISVAWGQLQIIEPLRAGGLDMGWVWPKEGVLGFFNGECTIKGTAKKKEAEAFANYLIGPDYGARLAEISGYASASAIAVENMTPEVLKKVGVDPNKLKLLTFKELIPDRPTWQRIWDEVKAG